MPQPARPGGTLRALVTNDDGVACTGLHALADAAVSSGMQVVVVAPSWDASGSSASMTAVVNNGKVSVETVADQRSRSPVYGVHAPPAFIVRAAMYGAFGPPPDLVLAGINRGLNTGRAVLHSGTVGAALTAATYGRSGLALSAEVEGEGWSEASRVAGSAVDWLVSAPEATVLNVNVPAPGPDGLLGVRSTTLADVGCVEGSVTEASGGIVAVTFGDADEEPAAGTDSAALADGWVSVTAIRGVTEDTTFDLESVLYGVSRT